MQKSSFPLYPQLDGLRFFAALLVVAFHSHAVIPGGFLAVDIFFVISGFLTVKMLRAQQISQGRIDIRRFIVSRVRRLWPLLAVVSAFSALCAYFVLGSKEASFAEFLWPTIYLSNVSFSEIRSPKFMTHSWSVSAEMQFYALVALIMAVTAKLGRLPLGVLCLGLYLALALWRFASAALVGDYFEIYFLPQFHGPAILLGAAVASYDAMKINRRIGQVALIALLLLIFLGEMGNAMSIAVQLFSVELLSALLLIYVITAPSEPVLTFFATPVFAKLGVYSYGIYLWHHPLSHLPHGLTGWTLFVALSIASTGLAVVTYHHVETRFHKPRSKPWMQQSTV